MTKLTVIEGDNQAPRLYIRQLMDFCQIVYKLHGNIEVAVDEDGLGANFWRVADMFVETLPSQDKILVLGLLPQKSNHLTLVDLELVDKDI